MSQRVLLSILSMVLLGTTQALSGQNAVKPSLRVTRVELAHLISVEVTVFSPERDLLVPYCGGGDGKSEYLCVPPSYLEVRTAQVGHRMNLRHGGVLGAVPADRRKSQLTQPGRAKISLSTSGRKISRLSMDSDFVSWCPLGPTNNR